MKSMYPKCANSFIKWYKSDINYEKIYQKIGCPSPFDVTLRDGLQTLSKEEQHNFTTDEKLKMYYKLISLHNIKNIEIGSIVSKNVLPIFQDTIHFSSLIKQNETDNDNKPDNYILIPNSSNLKKVIKKYMGL